MNAQQHAGQRRILLYGDVNLNIMDGSAVWLVSMATALAATNATVDVLLKAPVLNDRLTSQILALDGVTVIDDHAPDGVHEKGYSPRLAAQRIVQLDAAGSYDVVITRGWKIAFALAQSGRMQGRLWPYLTDVPQDASGMTPEVIERLQVIARCARRVLCQTEDTRSFLEFHVPNVAGKAVLLPPMVPDSASRTARPAAILPPLRLVYAGKFAKRWRTLEMCQLPAALAERGVPCEITLIGDKFQDDPGDPAWAQKMRQAVSAPGVLWLGGMSREEALAELGGHHAGLSWRDPAMDTSHELSTKLLEYLAIGIPPLVNRTAMHETLLGADYPLFVSDETVVDKVEEIYRHPGLLRQALEACGAAIEQFRISKVAASLASEFDRAVPQPRDKSESAPVPRRVLLAGHDFKFAGELIDWLSSRSDVALEIDGWESLHKHDPDRSAALLDGADVVICEWAGPNAVWYSREKRARQKLIVRLHMFELNAPWLSDINVDAIDVLVCVSDYYAKLAVERLSIDPARVVVVPNTVDTSDLWRPKFANSEFHLGIVGVVPLRKRLDRALDLTERLARKDARFTLHIRGRLPQEYPWEWKKPIVQSYYREQYRRALHEAPLRGHVALDYFGPDMGSWLRRIGWVLSPSTDESFHLAPMEGMASGAIPLIWSRPGAQEIFGREWMIGDIDEAIEYVMETVNDPDLLRQRSALAQEGARAYDTLTVMRCWSDLLELDR